MGSWLLKSHVSLLCQVTLTDAEKTGNFQLYVFAKNRNQPGNSYPHAASFLLQAREFGDGSSSVVEGGNVAIACLEVTILIVAIACYNVFCRMGAF